MTYKLLYPFPWLECPKCKRWWTNERLVLENHIARCKGEQLRKVS